MEGEGSTLQSMAVDPFSLTGVSGVPKHTKDGTAGNMSVAVLYKRRVEPADPRCARDGVEAESPYALGVAAVDGIAHRCFVWFPHIIPERVLLPTP